MQPPIATGLMTVKKAANFLSLSPSTLYGWAWQRKIPFVKVGRALRFDRADLERFVRLIGLAPKQAGTGHLDLQLRSIAARLAKGRKEAAIGSL